MQIDPITGGCLRVWLTDDEIEEWGLHAHAHPRRIRRLVRQIASVAGWAEHRRLLVEMIEVEGGGILLITPQENPMDPAVYEFAHVDDLLDLLIHWQDLPAATPPYISLYTVDGGYRMAIWEDAPLSEAQSRLLWEYATPVGQGPVTAAYCKEYGEQVYAGLLTAPVPRLPERGDPPH